MTRQKQQATGRSPLHRGSAAPWSYTAVPTEVLLLVSQEEQLSRLPMWTPMVAAAQGSGSISAEALGSAHAPELGTATVVCER